jgi:hypothetical protein
MFFITDILSLIKDVKLLKTNTFVRDNAYLSLLISGFDCIRVIYSMTKNMLF